MRPQHDSGPVIYAIPGLGTTAALFQNISVPGYELKVLSWPEPKRSYTLKTYAQHFLQQIDLSQGPVNLIGVSFGGMICSELSDLIDTKKVVLISSCRDNHEFPAFLKLLRYLPVHRIIPEQVVRFMAKNSGYIIGFDRALKPEFVRMTDSMQENYFSRCINYIIFWDKVSHKRGLISIHGTSDKFLAYKKGNRDYTIANGSHAMIIYNSEEINRILATEFYGS